MGYRPITQKNGENVAGPYTFISYAEIERRITLVSNTLLKLFKLTKGDIVTIYSKNRLEWILTEWSSMALSMPTVALYDTFGPDNLVYVLNHCESKIVFGSLDRVENLLKSVESCKFLQFVVSYDDTSKENKKSLTKTFKKHNIKLCFFSDLLKEPEKPVKIKFVKPKPEDLYTIMYTSGTTGNPKGVMITHRNIISTCVGVAPKLGGVHDGDVYISYLPLAHILERVAFTCMFIHGSKIGFYQGDPLKLVDDIQELKPTLMTGVPRVFNRIYAKVSATIEESGYIKRKLFSMAFNSKKAALLKHKKPSGFWESLVFSKIKARLGGRMRIILSGGAPLPPATQEFVRICFGCPIVQGYGLTETTAGGTVTDPDDLIFGEAGSPKYCCEVKLVSVPDLDYTVDDKPRPRGEICFRGPNVALGYYKDPEKTKEDFDEDGFFHTGDIGEFTERGTLKIIDRKKNIFKLSQGEYIAAEDLENVFVKSRYVEQIWVYGDSYQTFLIAILFPKIDNLKADLSSKDVDIYTSQEARDLVLKDLETIARGEKRQGFEIIKNVRFAEAEFTPDNDLATPTMKLKRPQLKTRYQNEIDEMYEELANKEATNKGEKKTAPKQEKKREEKPKKKVEEESSGGSSQDDSDDSNDEKKEETSTQEVEAQKEDKESPKDKESSEDKETSEEKETSKDKESSEEKETKATDKDSSEEDSEQDTSSS